MRNRTDLGIKTVFIKFEENSKELCVKYRVVWVKVIDELAILK